MHCTMTEASETYNWRLQTENDVRLQQITQSVNILLQKLKEISTSGDVTLPQKASLRHYQQPINQQTTTRDERHLITYVSSSSDVETHEIDPMDYLSDFEPNESVHKHIAPVDEDQNMEPKGSNHSDAEGGSDADKEYEDEECRVCHFDGNESQMLLCDGCDQAYHLYCLHPPLTCIPDGDWFCPKCAERKRPEEPQLPVSIEEEKQPEEMPIDPITPAEPVQKTIPSMSWATISVDKIADAFQNLAMCNSVLIHACSCDTNVCTHTDFSSACVSLKRFLKSASWASHDATWRTMRIAKATAELFAYHSQHCENPSCQVPLCAELREEEFV
uniref:Uncharacterized protein AlNc14C125G6779 n=1 Tax=Albugo laibachii Nc14 TaxID=890382 RepID=F0WJQ3_9STRA|nr:conserved hypothetical protein [Albugo laibachii Nc14]|eukprot:CCA21504.1 conserved hypothetical protein [Albugo laibachii Nc14]